MSEPSARARFVQYCKSAKAAYPMMSGCADFNDILRGLCEAFADQECGPDAPCAVRARKYATKHAKRHMEWYDIDSKRRPIEHAACRAALLKECGL